MKQVDEDSHKVSCTCPPWWSASFLLAELFQQLCSLNWKFFWPEISFEATGGRHISRDYEGGRRGGGDDIGDTTELLGDTTLKGGMIRARGDDTEGGDDIQGTPHVVPPSWGTPHVVPPSVVSPYVVPPFRVVPPHPCRPPLQCGVS